VFYKSTREDTKERRLLAQKRDEVFHNLLQESIKVNTEMAILSKHLLEQMQALNSACNEIKINLKK